MLFRSILAVHGGLTGEGVAQTFRLELHNRSGKPSTAHCKGTTDSLFAQFNELGVRKDFLAYEQVLSPLSNMKQENVQQSAVRISLINAVRRPPGYRKTHGYKVRSLIERLDGQPLRAFEEVAELTSRIAAQGFKAAPGSSDTAFMLHPDQPDLFNPQGQRLLPAKPPKRTKRLKERTLI